MALTRGFLRPLSIGSKDVVRTGIVVGTVFSFFLYYLFYYFRETIRVLTGYFGDGLLIELTPQENFYYNLFYGSIAAIIGFYVFTHFVLSNSLDRKNIRRRVRQRHILNDQAFVSWTFLSAFSRFTSLIGIWFLILPMQFDINFLDEFPLLLILIPIVLFLNGWTIIVKTFGRKAYRWFLYATLYVSVLSVGYASINSLDYRQINRKVKVYSGDLTYGITVPRSQSQELLQHRGFIIDVYVLNDSTGSSEPIIYWNNANTKIDLDEVNDYVAQARSAWHPLVQHRLIANLHIDKRVPLQQVNTLKQALRRAGLNTTQYATAAKHSKYPSYYPWFRYWGISQSLPPYYPEFEAFLDSAESLNLSNYRLKISESAMYRIPAYQVSNRVVVGVDAQSAYLNGSPVSTDSLSDLLYQLTKKYAPYFFIDYSPDEAISYERYITYLDLLHSVTDRLRNELSYRHYQHPLDCWNYPKSCDTIKAAYPRNIIEWTPEEKRLMKLIEHAQGSQ